MVSLSYLNRNDQNLQLQEAIKQYVLHNGKIFEPVEFEIVTDENIAILSAQFSTDDVVLFEGQKRLLSIWYMPYY